MNRLLSYDSKFATEISKPSKIDSVNSDRDDRKPPNLAAFRFD